MKILKNLKSKYILILILISTAFLHLYRLDYPNKYVFDEVYHAFTAKEFAIGNKEAWEWWTKPPPGVAFEWTHPPLAKEIMAMSMTLLGTIDAWAYRLPGAIFGILSVYLVYLLGLRILKTHSVSVMAAFLFSIDGLNFVQSRTAMNDIYYVTFLLASILFMLKRNFFISAVFFGLALSSKWASLYLIFFYFCLFLFRIIKNKINFFSIKQILKNLNLLLIFLLISPTIYLLSYLPFFMVGHSFDQFIQLQQQMWWYHTGLKATHAYSSPWWSWPLNLYPVWYFVDYSKNAISNIFTSGNPVIFWLGTASIVLTLFEFIKTKSEKLFIILLGFTIFWLPWALSPRIMFLYHFSPSVPFLCLALANQLGLEFENEKRRKVVYILLFLSILGFILLYPFLTGIPLPRNIINLFFLSNLSNNPF